MDINAQWLIEFFRAQAKLGYEEGDYIRTRNSCEIVLGQASDDAAILRLLGDAALSSKDGATARRCYERLHELCPKDAEIAVNLGKAYLQINAWNAAALALHEARTLDPTNAVAEQMFAMVQRMRQALNTLGESGSAGEPGRNDECPCGSGRKYKKCCLAKSTGIAVLEALRHAIEKEEWQHALNLIQDIHPLTLEVRRAEAIASYRLGKRSYSKKLLESLLGELPDDAEILAALADVELDGKDLPKVERLARRALTLDPENRIAWLVLCAFHVRMGNEQEAEQGLRTVVKFAPDYRMAWERLGNLLRKQRRWGDELKAVHDWVDQCPENHEAWYQVGFVIITQGGGAQEASQYFLRAIELKQDFYEAHCWLGQCYADLGEFEKAVHSLLVGLNFKPDYDLGWILLGGVYQKIGRQREAEGCQMRAIAANPNNGFAWNNLATTYLDAHEFQEAEQVVRVALKIAPDYAALWNNLGIILMAVQRINEAKECFYKVIDMDPGFQDVYINLSGIEASYGDLTQAIEHLSGILDRSELARSNLLFVANYHADLSAHQVYAIYSDVAGRFYQKRKYFSYDNERRQDRRLRIGYVSPDFRQHVCSQFIEPLLKNHSRDKFEVFAYSAVRSEDSVTERYKGYVDFWRPCVGVDDVKVAETIRQDGIDILVDLAGHTANNRLGVFALKPAPVQVSWWIGFAYTTGLKAVDYFLADEEMLPLGCEEVFSEQPWRMVAPAVCYPPRSDLPEVNELPALRNGFITFGTLTRPIRLNHRVIRCWSELLKKVPNSKLMLNSHAFLDVELSDHYASLFAAHGIPRDRLDIGCTTPPWSVLASMDIALDCFPHSSGTTLYESLWMGLPYVTLRDRPSMGRVGSLILSGIGRSEWIADSEAEYIDKLVELASDVELLKNIRAGLREEMRASPLCDDVSFAKRVESAYQSMWKRYCEQGEQQ